MIPRNPRASHFHVCRARGNASPQCCSFTRLALSFPPHATALRPHPSPAASLAPHHHLPHHLHLHRRRERTRQPPRPHRCGLLRRSSHGPRRRRLPRRRLSRRQLGHHHFSPRHHDSRRAFSDRAFLRLDRRARRPPRPHSVSIPRAPDFHLRHPRRFFRQRHYLPHVHAHRPRRHR